jgi:hypothetical protein
MATGAGAETNSERTARLKRGDPPGIAVNPSQRNTYPNFDNVGIGFSDLGFDSIYKLRSRLLGTINILGDPNLETTTLRANTVARLFEPQDAATRLGSGTHVCTYIFYSKDGVVSMKLLKVYSKLEFGTIHNVLVKETEPDVIYSTGEMRITVEDSESSAASGPQVTSAQFNLESGSFMGDYFGFLSPNARDSTKERMIQQLKAFLTTKETPAEYTEDILIKNTGIPAEEIAYLKQLGYRPRQYTREGLRQINIKKHKEALSSIIYKIKDLEQRIAQKKEQIPKMQTIYADMLSKRNAMRSRGDNVRKQEKLMNGVNPEKIQQEIEELERQLQAKREELAAKEGELGEVVNLGGGSRKRTRRQSRRRKFSKKHARKHTRKS